MGRLDGRAAVVTGAASGIGQGIATSFAEEGAQVVVADFDPVGGQRVAEAVDGAFVECDVTREADSAYVTGQAAVVDGGLTSSKRLAEIAEGQPR